MFEQLAGQLQQPGQGHRLACSDPVPVEGLAVDARAAGERGDSERVIRADDVGSRGEKGGAGALGARIRVHFPSMFGGAW